MTKRIEELWKLVCRGQMSFEEYQKSYVECAKK